MSNEPSSPLSPKTAAPSPAPTLEWRKHLVWLTPATMGILLAAAVWIWSESRATRVRMEVYQAYSSAATADAFEQVARAWPNEPEAALSLLQAGELRFTAGEYVSALALYEEFLDTHATHRMANHAAWGRVLSLEAGGKIEEALQIFLGYNDLSEFYPQSLFGRARCLEKLGRPQEALVIYDLIETEFPETGWYNQSLEFRKPLEISLRNKGE